MMSFETGALVPTLIIKRIPDHIGPARFLWGPSCPLIHHVALVLQMPYIITYDIVYFMLL